MEKNIYTPMEQVLIEGAKLLEENKAEKKWLETSIDLGKALELDLLLLDLEEKADMMDGIKLEEWIL